MMNTEQKEVTDSRTVASVWKNNGRIHGRTNQIELIRGDYSWQGRNVIIIKGEDCDVIAEKIMQVLNP